MKQNLGTLTPKTFDSYTDSHGRTVIANFKTRTAYICSKEDEKKYYLLSNRYSIIVAAVMLLGFNWKWVWAIVIGVFALIAAEVYYRTTFLNNLQQVYNVDFPERKSIYKIARESNTGQRLFRFFMFLLFGILLIVYMFMTVKDWNSVFAFKNINDVTLVAFTIAGSIFGFYGAFQFARAMAVETKNRQERD